ncbi:MAG: hypothetical protein LLG97_05495 [Deltaproteobacteria bacterium]|nr:hypothetical protein [Deltaproteobacteria bacterium]
MICGGELIVLAHDQPKAFQPEHSGQVEAVADDADLEEVYSTERHIVLPMAYRKGEGCARSCTG